MASLIPYTVAAQDSLADRFPYPDTDPEEHHRLISECYKFMVEGCASTLGLILPTVVCQFQWPVDAWVIDHSLALNVRVKTETFHF